MIRYEKMRGIVERLINQISLITAIEEDAKTDKTNLLYKPAHLSIQVKSGANIDDVMKKVDESLDIVFL